jgi:enoyl-CoA hydratase/carnithine racemase
MPFVSLGLIAEAASGLLAPRLMGQRRAFEFLDATLATEFGIANIVVAPEDVDAEGLKAAREIAALPAGAEITNDRDFLPIQSNRSPASGTRSSIAALVHHRQLASPQHSALIQISMSSSR